MATGEDLGREPEWNDGDLPEVDVEIPDDLRELDRDVQAYRRERRQQRRRRLILRLVPGYRRLGPFGVLGPIVAVTLLATAVFGSMMSLLGPRSTSETGADASAETSNGTAAKPESGSPSARGHGVGGRLPDVPASVDGREKRLSSLQSAVVLTVPAHCDCAAKVRSVASTAHESGVDVYLSGRRAEVRTLTDGVTKRHPHVLDDATEPLAKRYHPTGLSAVLVDRRGTVIDVVRRIDDGVPLSAERVKELRAHA